MDMRETLRRFMLAPAPSGYEYEMAALLKAALSEYCDQVTTDNAGNVIGFVRGKAGGRRAMAFAHMDSLGFIVRHIGADGYLFVDRLGGIPEKALPALRLLARTEEGEWVPGVFGLKSHHAMTPEEKTRVEGVQTLAIDIGASSADEVRAMGIYPGCPVVYEPSYIELAAGRVSGTAVDDRGGCAALVRAAERLSAERPQWDCYLVGTVWEEFNLRGAMLAARTVKPEVAFSLDVTLTGDAPGLEGRFDAALGGGACVQLYSFHGRGTLNGTLPNEKLFRVAKAAAQKRSIPFQRFAALGILTDAAYIQLEGMGTAVLELGFPARYTHTPVEVCDPCDIEALSELTAGILADLPMDFDAKRLL